MENISPVNGYNINYKRSQELEIEVHRFFAGMKDQKFEKKPKEEKKKIGDAIFNSNRNARTAKEERLKTQRPVLIKFKEMFGKYAWQMLSGAVGGIVTAQNLGCVYRGEFSIANKEKWSQIETKALDLIKAEVEKLKNK